MAAQAAAAEAAAPVSGSRNPGGARHARPARPDAGAGPRAGTVLVIEPDEALESGLAAQLRAAGFAPRAVRTGRAAIHSLADGDDAPAAVVLDWDVRDVTGYRIYQLLRDDSVLGDLPVVVLSGQSFQEIYFAGRRTPAPEAFFQKPARPDAVAREVRRLVPARGHARQHAA